MNRKTENPYERLKRIFHEPNRMAIMTCLLDQPHGMAFTILRDRCALTDGNLSRHLKTLEDAQAVRIQKTFVGSRPRTTVHLPPKGRERFLQYLNALEAVLKEAADKVDAASERSAAFLDGEPVQA